MPDGCGVGCAGGCFGGVDAAILNGPIKAAIASALKFDLHGHAQGADAVAKSLVDGSLLADVFILVSAGAV